MQAGNVYTDWADLVAAAVQIQGYKSIQFDDSIVTPCVIPPGVWDMTDTVLVGYVHDAGTAQGFKASMTISDGASFTHLRKIAGDLEITNLNNTVAPIVIAPYTGSQVRAQFELGTAVLGDFPLINNNGLAPFLDLSNLAAGQDFILRGHFQLTGTSPAIQMGASPGKLAVTCLETRINSGMIIGTNPAALISIFLGMAAFARQQGFAGTITRGQGNSPAQSPNPGVGFTPLVRTLMFPAPQNQMSAPPSTAALVPATGAGMNTTYRLSAAAGVINQQLPQIRAAAPPIGSSTGVSGALNAEGCIVVIREFSGVNGVSLTPFAGETIEGGPGPLLVPAGGCRILQSDGISDWRFIAGYL